MSIQTKRLIRFLARILVTISLLVWVFSRVDVDQFLLAVKTARWHYLIGVWVLTAAFFGVQSIALQVVLRKQGCEVSRANLFAASSVTALYSLVLPSILSTGVKWYILKKHTGKGSNVLSSMLYNQFSLLFAMIVLGLLALMLTNPSSQLLTTNSKWLLPVVCGGLLAAMILIYWLLANSRTGTKITEALGFLLRPFPRHFHQKGQDVLSQIAAFQKAGLRFHLAIATINILDGLLVGTLIYLFAARSAHVDVALGVLVWLCAIVFVLGKVPISVANLGVREVTLVGLLASYGVRTSSALLMSMILFSSLIFMAAIGAVYQLYWSWSAAKNTAAKNLE
ncbi:MAG: flippase-like domain-containing protein [Phycisphaerales bacterium]|nr:MAG: flippase-like domain-containing protein [Phycisphaerales bacterium]